eukprot:m.238268 g.238268  ORF g.238268 m.238268 type:complete len:56 (-) comp21685_c0_seq1:130-297(-)
MAACVRSFAGTRPTTLATARAAKPSGNADITLTPLNQELDTRGARCKILNQSTDL